MSPVAAMPFLVWSGEVPTGLTAGWLGLPCEGERSWLAVRRLWWDETGGSVTEGGRQLAGPRTPDAYDTRPVPSAPVQLKPRPAEESSS